MTTSISSEALRNQTFPPKPDGQTDARTDVRTEISIYRVASLLKKPNENHYYHFKSLTNLHKNHIDKSVCALCDKLPFLLFFVFLLKI